MTAPFLVSADDHLVEPPHLWTSRLPPAFADRAPTVRRQKGAVVPVSGGGLDRPKTQFQETDDGVWCDVWHFEGVNVPQTMGAASVGYDRDLIELRPITFDEMRPGCYDPVARLADMDTAGIEASLCFPNLFTRFCGQVFHETEDKELALLCVKAYNDYVLDEWTAGSDGRLIPSGIVPLWDPELAAGEVWRCAERGMRAMAFSELPTNLGLPSVYTDHWDPFFRACEDTQTVVMEHVGSSSQLPTTSPDAPPAVWHALPAVNAAKALVDWLCAALPVRFPGLKLCLAECQIGWVPYFLGRLDRIWDHNRAYTGIADKLPEPPSTYFRSNVFVTFFDDQPGSQLIETIGVENVLFETDYPHGDSMWPDCLAVARAQTAHLSQGHARMVLRDNGRRLFRLEGSDGSGGPAR